MDQYLLVTSKSVLGCSICHFSQTPCGPDGACYRWVSLYIIDGDYLCDY